MFVLKALSVTNRAELSRLLRRKYSGNSPSLGRVWRGRGGRVGGVARVVTAVEVQLHHALLEGGCVQCSPGVEAGSHSPAASAQRSSGRLGQRVSHLDVK